MRQLEVALGAGGHFFEERRRAMLAQTIDPIPFFAGVARRVLARESVAAIRSWALMAGKV
jgi:hypothetical protein